MSKRINAVFGSGVFSKTLNVFQWDSDSALKAPHGYQYRLRADTLEWELVEMPPVEPEDEEATAEDYEAALKEMGVNV